MSTQPKEHLELVACGIPCEGCPVAGFSQDNRRAVDTILTVLGADIGYEPRIYPWDDAKADGYDIPGETNRWLREDAEALMAGSTQEKIDLVLRAVTKIVNEGCPTYSEGEI